jgi:hypothetical protein
MDEFTYVRFPLQRFRNYPTIIINNTLFLVCRLTKNKRTTNRKIPQINNTQIKNKSNIAALQKEVKW